MPACNAATDRSHKVACYYRENHEGPHSWETEPSKARRGIDRLLAAFPQREIEVIDSQGEQPIYATDLESGERYVVTRIAPGPWVLVRFVGGDEYAIWKHTGSVYRVGVFTGAVEDDPIITLETAPA